MSSGVITGPPKSLPVSLGLLSVSVLAFQVVIMQMLSLLQWHHFAYMVISTAMLGFGAAGSVLSLFRRWLVRHSRLVMPMLCLLTAVGMVCATRVAGGFGRFDSYLLFFEARQLLLLAASYLAYALPFFTAGLAITLAFVCEVGRVGSLYSANLAGSALGAVLVVVLVGPLRLEYLAPVLAVFPLAAGWILLPRSSVPRTRSIAALSLLVVLAIGAGFARPVSLAPSEYKDISVALHLPGAEVIHRSDSAFGRIEVVRSAAQRVAAGASLVVRDDPPVSDVMFVNGDSYGALLGRFGSASAHPYDATTRALPYALRDPGRVLVLDAATGTGVSYALAAGSRVDAVEENRAAVSLLRDRHPDWIDSLYLDPGVGLFVQSNRSVLSSSVPSSYDLIVAPELGSFGGETGTATLVGRYDLTRESFARMWQLLSPRGMIAVTVWADAPPRSLLRVLATWRELLDEVGVPPVAHIVGVRSWATITLVLSRSPLAALEHRSTRAFCERLGFDPLIMAALDDDERQRYNRLPGTELFDLVDALVSGDPTEVERGHRFSVRPVSDARPFFSRYLRLRSIPTVAETYGTVGVAYLELGTLVAWVTAVQIVLAAGLFVVAPLARVKWAPGGRRWTFLTFGGLGLGFMFFEIALIEQLVLLLATPVYATAAVLAVLLVASGAGSLLSTRLRTDSRAMLVVGTVLAGTTGAYGLGLVPLLRAAVGWSVPARTMLVLVVLAAPAVGMGTMFPLALRRLASGGRSQLAWACATDSALSVVATAIAPLVALEGGYGLVLGLSAGAYLVAGLASTRLGAQSQPVMRASPRT